VYVTEHFDVELVSAASVQVALGEKLPDADPLERVTVPPGLDFVPVSVSVTVAVQVVLSLIGTEPGEQETLVDVERTVTVSVFEPLLGAWTGSLAV
jgi:hypothetical protein